MIDDIATADDCYDTAPVVVPRVPIRPKAPVVDRAASERTLASSAAEGQRGRIDPYAMPTGPRFGLKASTTTGLRAHVGIRDEKQGA